MRLLCNEHEHSILHDTTQYYSRRVLYTTQYYSVLHSTTMYYSILQYTIALNYTLLRCTTWCYYILHSTYSYTTQYYIVLHTTTDLRVGLKNVAGSRGRINKKTIGEGIIKKKCSQYYDVLLYTTQYYDVLHDATLYNTLLFCTIHWQIALHFLTLVSSRLAKYGRERGEAIIDHPNSRGDINN